MGTKFFPASDLAAQDLCAQRPGPWRRAASPGGRGVLPSPAPEPGDGPAPSTLAQPQALHSLWRALPQPWTIGRLW